MSSKHLENYLSQLETTAPEAVSSIKNTVNEVVPKHIKTFSCRDHITGLLLGNVQSGKTGQILGITASAADEGFELFVLLTMNNVYLYEQTLKRAANALQTFSVCAEDNEIRFVENAMRKPVLIVLKKHGRVLRKWRNILSSSGFCSGRTLFVIDDEGDAASLNTKVNRKSQSQINKQLESLKHLAGSSIYLQVTATPQALILQTKTSGWKPSFVHYFPPGKDYLGGKFFYCNPPSYAIRITGENELEHLRDEEEHIADGLRSSLLAFLITGAHLFISKQGQVCNFLVHPSVRISDHETIAERLGQYLNEMLAAISEDQMKDQLKEAWKDLQKTKPDLSHFDEINRFIHKILNEQKIKIFVLNSKGDLQTIDYSSGLNIIVGGNSLSRGLTVTGLQTVYYCRTAKIPQADTFWQHSRMFGYDRDPGLMRVFLPSFLLKLFTELSNANCALIAQIEAGDLDNISLLYPPGIRPTREDVVDRNALDIIVGGVNYFPNFPKRKNIEKLDELLSSFGNTGKNEIDFDLAIEILEHTESEAKADWSNKTFTNCLKALKIERAPNRCVLIVRRGRDIGKGTGTLLSPDDRAAGDRIRDCPVLTLYRIKGEEEKGWDGAPLWIPNIKLPEEMNFYRTD